MLVQGGDEGEGELGRENTSTTGQWTQTAPVAPSRRRKRDARRKLITVVSASIPSDPRKGNEKSRTNRGFVTGDQKGYTFAAIQETKSSSKKAAGVRKGEGRMCGRCTNCGSQNADNRTHQGLQTAQMHVAESRWVGENEYIG